LLGETSEEVLDIASWGQLIVQMMMRLSMDADAKVYED